MVAALSRRKSWLLLAAALPLLMLAWLLDPSAPPLYDSLQGPVGPYKYLNPPAGSGPQHRNPLPGITVQKVSNGRFSETLVRTPEKVPQAILELGDGAVKVPHGITSVTLSARPVPPPGPISNGDLDGNVYLFGAKGSNGESLILDPKVGGLLELRKTGKELNAHMDIYRGGSWVPLSTLTFVNANYLATDAKSFGYYALVTPRRGNAFLSHYLALLIAALVVLVLVIAALIALRISRSHPATPA
jgi:hypothetical protein